MGTSFHTKAANTITTESSEFPNADTVIAQAAKLLGEERERLEANYLPNGIKPVG